MWKRFANLTLTQGRRLVVAVMGGTVVLMGIAMLVLPGPGIVVILLGLALLATEFIWAKRLLLELRRRGGQAANGVRGWFGWRGTTRSKSVVVPVVKAGSHHSAGQ